MGTIPSTQLELYTGVPLSKDSEDTFYFGNRSSQESYFANRQRVVIPQSLYRIDPTDNTIKIEKPYSQLYKCNYLRFRNSAYENKWFYCFVDQTEYVNDETTKVYFTIDPMMTWLPDLDYNFEECLIEREHSLSDSSSEAYVVEDLPIGEYLSDDITDVMTSLPGGLKAMCIVVASTFYIDIPYATGAIHNYSGGVWAGAFSGLYFTRFGTNSTGIADLITFINRASAAPSGSGSIVSVFLAPALFFPSFEGSDPEVITASYSLANNKIHRTNGNEPYNKKLEFFPFQKVSVTNHQGTDGDLLFEYFTNNTIQLKFTGDGNCTPSILMQPLNYKGMSVNTDEQLSVTGYPQLPWTSDTFKDWLANNGLKIGIGMATTAISSLASLATMGAGAGIATTAKGAAVSNLKAQAAQGAAAVNTGVSTLSDVANLFATMKTEQMKPPTLHGTSSSTISAVTNTLTISFYHKYISPYYVDRIDDYFQMFGYRSGKVKEPNTHGRQKWNYTKTVNCSLKNADVPADFIRQIESRFNRGVRLWKDTANIGNYHMSNPI